jgi:hypothetical protein
MWGELHESKKFDARLPAKVTAGTGNRLFRELGASLFYDCYDFIAKTPNEWQSDTLLAVDLFLGASGVDAQDDFDRFELTYLFASRSTADQVHVLDLVESIASKFDADITYDGRRYDRVFVTDNWDSCTSFLLQEWGEEPGSKELRRMIEEGYDQPA